MGAEYATPTIMNKMLSQYRLKFKGIGMFNFLKKQIHANAQTQVIMSIDARTTILRQHYKCSYKEALNLLHMIPQTLIQDATRFENTIILLKKKFNFSYRDLLDHPSVLTIGPFSIEQAFYVLNDYGFRDFSSNTLVNFNDLIKKTPVDLLDLKLITADPVCNVLNLLPQDTRRIIENKLAVDVYRKYPLIVIHKGLLVLLYSVLLECSVKDAILLMQNETLRDDCSLTYQNEVIFVLKEHLKIPVEKLRTSTLLDHYSNNLPATINRLRKDGKDKPISDLQKISKASLLPDHTSQVEQICRDYGITDGQLYHCSQVLRMSTTDVTKGLKEMDEIEEFIMLKNDINYLKILPKLEHAKHNLELLEGKSPGVWTVKKLLLPVEQIQELSSLNHARCTGKEMEILLSYALDKPSENIKHVLEKHPKFRMSVLYNSTNLLLQDLFDWGVSKEQIWNALPLLLYDQQLVMRQLSEMESYPELQPFEKWRSHNRLLDLVLYYMEKRNHFSFDGVFITTETDVLLNMESNEDEIDGGPTVGL